MREIKFRGKRIEDGEWIIGDLVTETDADLIVKRMFIHLRLSPVDFVGDSLTSKLCLHEVDPETVGQYTGLEDVSAKEIYERDAVEFDILMNSGSIEERIDTFYETVTFDDGCYFAGDWFVRDIKGRVISNICE